MFIKTISTLSSLTFLSRILGYVRDLLIARIIGAGMISDAFFVAFKLPNLFRRVFAEGAMNSAFIPVVSGIFSNSGRIESDKFFSKVFSLLLNTLFFILVIIEIFMPFVISIIAPGFEDDPLKKELAVQYSQLAFPFVFFICLTSLVGSYLNTLGKFAAMAFTPIILNLCLISVLMFLSGEISEKENITKILSLSISVAGFIQLVWLLFNLKINSVRLRIHFKELSNFVKFDSDSKRLFQLFIPALVGNGVYQINLLIDMILASTLPDGSISYLYYADRVNQLPLGVFGIAISTALLPVLSKKIKEKKFEESNIHISNSIKISFLLSIPATMGIIILSNEIVNFLFLRGEFTLSDSILTSKALLVLSLGLPAFILIKVLVTPFFASEDTKTPVYVSLICMFINLILNLILIGPYQHIGLVIATTISAWINVILLFFLLNKKKIITFETNIISVILKSIMCSLIMAILISNFIDLNILSNEKYFFISKSSLMLLFTIFCAIIVYGLLIYFSNKRDLKLLWKSKIQ